MTETTARPQFTNLTTEQHVTAGAKPLRFWINSMGEYGHFWDDNTQSVGGSVNINEALSAAGLTDDACTTTQQAAIERAAGRQRSDTFLDPREHVLWRAWEHYQPLGSDLWRVYAGIEYEREVLNPVRLTLEIEYWLTPTDKALVQSWARGLWGPNAEVEEMGTPVEDATDGKEHYVVMFPIMGKSVGHLFGFQLNWLTKAAQFNDDLNSVI